MSYQVWVGLGNLTADPEMKYVGEHAKTTFSIAINAKYGDKEEVLYVDVECWEKLAETVAEYLRKGRQCLVQGRWKMDEFEDRDGNKRRKWYVRADTVRFVGSKPDDEDDRPRRRRDRDDDDRPRRRDDRDKERSPRDDKYDDLPF